MKNAEKEMLYEKKIVKYYENTMNFFFQHVHFQRQQHTKATTMLNINLRLHFWHQLIIFEVRLVCNFYIDGNTIVRFFVPVCCGRNAIIVNMPMYVLVIVICIQLNVIVIIHPDN